MDRQAIFSKRSGWHFRANALSFMLVVGVAAWPVVVETCAPEYFAANLQIYRAAYRHFQQKQAVVNAMQGAFRHGYAQALSQSTTQPAPVVAARVAF